MNSQSCLFPLFTVCSLLLANGCMESPDPETIAPFEDQELDACLAIVVDMSGSFHDQWNDRAYDLFLELSERFFTEAMGTNTKLVIGQLSGSDQVVIFEGRPGDLKKRFGSPEALSQFLKDSADPKSSRVFAATGKTVDYLSAIPGVTENTRLLTVILSDMRDSETDPQAGTPSAEKMMESLKRYRAKGGGLALYFVAHDERQRWHALLQEAGFPPGHYIIEGQLSANPQLPRFD